MAKSLFQKKIREDPSLDPYELIEPEIVHLQKGYSIRHGPKGAPKAPSWLLIILFCCLAWVYLMDPLLHAWYKGEAVRSYLYLRDFGSGNLVRDLAATGIFSPDEVETLNHRHGSFREYYGSPQAATQEATTIIDYMTNVRLLHEGKYQHLDPIGRLRYLLFIRTGLYLPTDWTFLDPGVGE